MKFEAVTIKDIAKALGLSVSTVSRALRDSYEIGEQTKKRVQDYAKEYNYKPNPIALSLKERKTRSIGIVVSEIANTFFSQVIDGIESIAYNNGYNVIITQSKESAERERMLLNDLVSRSVDGLIISIAAETIDYSAFRDLKEKGLPIVFFDRVVNEIDTHKVTIDNFKGAYEAAENLIKNGYKNIAVIANNKNLAITQDRLNGFIKAMEDNNLVIKKTNILYCEHGGMGNTEVEEAIMPLLKKANKPDAIFALSDKLSIETLRILKDKNIRVPHDIALIGFSNSNDSSLMDPPLSIIQQPAFSMGQIAASQLLEIINSRRQITDFKNTVLLPKVILRKSSSGKTEI